MVLKEGLERGVEVFSKEAERWYRIMAQFNVPKIQLSKDPEKAKKSRTPSRRGLRLSFINKRKSLLSKLEYLYGPEKGKEAFDKIDMKMAAFIKSRKPKKLKYQDAHFNPLDRFTQKDVVLITYPDTFYQKSDMPLRSLWNFSNLHLKGTINTIHILPFYPYSSDRGFSVINYKKVNKRLGTWDDINQISTGFNMMFDGVFNHISSKSLWFKHYLKGSQKYDNHFMAFDSRDAISKEDMKKIVRPRTSDLLTEFSANGNRKYVWTTFSPDQVDLNFKEPRVMLRIVDVLLRYVQNGATMIRLDAVNYIWKEPGTSCVHLKQTHVVVQLIRDILDIVAPSVSIVTETNVPHAYNIRYFGNGKNEAQMVYNFALPPLVLYTFYRGNTKYISRWADRLEKVSKYCTYFNFLASHDGIGVTPVKRILPQGEVNFLVREAKKRGSLIQYKNQGDGDKVPYELNITWWNAINNENIDEDDEIRLQRYLASIALSLSIKGVPGIYVHSLFGTKNDYETVKRTKHNRDINRKNMGLDALEKDLKDDTLTKKVFESTMELIRQRTLSKPFHPDAEQKILPENEHVFSLLRISNDRSERMLVIINVTNTDRDYTVNTKKLGLGNFGLYDVMNKRTLRLESGNIRVNEFDITLRPYEVLWLRATMKEVG